MKIILKLKKLIPWLDREREPKPLDKPWLLKEGHRASRLDMISLGIAFVIGALLFLSLSGAGSKPGGSQNPNESCLAVAAVSDIPAGTIFTSELVTLKRIPKSLSSEGLVVFMEGLSGKISASDISRGELIYFNDIRESKATLHGAERVSAGKVALGVEADLFSSVGNSLSAGDRVDFLVTLNKDISLKAETKILYQKLRVIDVGSLNKSGGESYENSSEEDTDSKCIILEVTPSQAKNIAFYCDNAKTRFTLRSRSPR